jgi:hypothetical protein
LVWDLISEGVDATIPKIVRETVEAVQTILGPDADEEAYTSIKKVGNLLSLDRSAAYRRVVTAFKAGYLRNPAEKGKPIRICTGEPLPMDREILPSAEDLQAHITTQTVRFKKMITLRESLMSRTVP